LGGKEGVGPRTSSRRISEGEKKKEGWEKKKEVDRVTSRRASHG